MRQYFIPIYDVHDENEEHPKGTLKIKAHSWIEADGKATEWLCANKGYNIGSHSSWTSEQIEAEDLGEVEIN